MNKHVAGLAAVCAALFAAFWWIGRLKDPTRGDADDAYAADDDEGAK